jgi:hypothetical protein
MNKIQMKLHILAGMSFIHHMHYLYTFSIYAQKETGKVEKYLNIRNGVVEMGSPKNNNRIQIKNLTPN